MRCPVAISDKVGSRRMVSTGALLTNHDQRNVERSPALQISLKLHAKERARLREVRAYLVAVLKLDDLLLPGNTHEPVLPIDVAIGQQPDRVAAVLHDGDAILHRDLQLSTLVWLPVNDEW